MARREKKITRSKTFITHATSGKVARARRKLAREAAEKYQQEYQAKAQERAKKVPDGQPSPEAVA